MGMRVTRCAIIPALLALGITLLAGCAPPWAAQPPPAPYFSATDISMDSPTDGWASGDWIIPTRNAYGEVIHQDVSVLAHFQAGQWRLAPASVTSVSADVSFRLVRMRTASDGWATTLGGDIYHYDGVRWRQAFPPTATPKSAIVIQDLQVLPSGVGWGVGEGGILRYADGIWTNVTATLPPRPADWESDWNYPGLRSVSIVSATNAWATGDGGVIWQYDGARWRIVTSPYFPNQYYASASVDGYVASPATLIHASLTMHSAETIYAAQMLSSNVGWSVGGAVRTPTSCDNWGPAAIERYQGGAWRVTHLVLKSTSRGAQWPFLFTLAMTSAQDGWVGGAWAHGGASGANDGDENRSQCPKLSAPLLLHYQSGQWMVAPAPSVGAIHRIVMLSADDGWAAADGGLIHYSGSQWRLISVSPSA